MTRICDGHYRRPAGFMLYLPFPSVDNFLFPLPSEDMSVLKISSWGRWNMI